MADEVEAAGFNSLGGFFRRGKAHDALPPGTPCPNCATPLQGPWCHACGQLAEDFHRSTVKLLAESVREFFDFDNRAWHTLPDLLFRPGRLTRAYLDGHRTPQVPPLRLFLVALVLLFLFGLNGTPNIPPQFDVPANREAALKKIDADRRLSPDDKRDIEKDLKGVNVDIDGNRSTEAKWLSVRIKNALAHPKEFIGTLQNWGERFAVLMLPLSAALLGLLFVFQRRFFLFDHIIFSMHSLTFLCLLLCATILWDRFTAIQIGGLPLLAAPVHLFFHMRGVYATSVFGTLFRMLVLFVGSVVGFAFLVIGLLWVALSVT